MPLLVKLRHQDLIKINGVRVRINRFHVNAGRAATVELAIFDSPTVQLPNGKKLHPRDADADAPEPGVAEAMKEMLGDGHE